MRAEGRLGSAALRGALWITLIALVATAAALTVQYLGTTRLLAERSHAAVDDEMSALVQRYQIDGIEGVAQAIERQQQVPRIHEFFYLLAAPEGTPIVGNLLVWPSSVTQTGFSSFETDVINTRGVASRRWVEARAVMLGGGVRLLVGDFADERVVLEQRYWSVLLWSLAVTGALGLLLGWWYSRRGLRFVGAVSDAGDRFLAGRMQERLPISGRRDEYDRLAETINRTFAEVERLVDSLRAATDGLAHDLKTPLTRIKARLELAALEQQEDAAASAQAMEATRDDLQALLDLIDATLSLARAEATPIASFAPVPLAQVVRETIELYQPLADDKQLSLDAKLSEASVLGAPSLLAQLTTNLLDNAIKYTPPGGRIEIGLERLDGQARLSVCDSGPGIPPSERDRALMRFHRLDASRSARGSGLGLSIVAAVTRIHGGTLELRDNTPGLCAEVRLPCVGAG